MEIIDVKRGVLELAKGELVIIPTETVYGLAADAFNEMAVGKIFEAKGRSKANPLILHVSNLEMLKKCIIGLSEKEEKLIKSFWPGPLTLLFKKSKFIPSIVTAGLDTVCIRMPDHDLTLELIEKLGRPVAAPSANLGSRPSPTSLDAAIFDLEARGVKFAVKSVDSKIGLESTILDLSGEKPLILRLGGLAKNQIEEILGEKVFLANKEVGKIAKSPGMNFKHYAPNGEIILVYPWESFGEKISKNLSSENLEKDVALEAHSLPSKFATVEEAIAQFYQQFKSGIICVDDRVKLYEGYEVLPLGPSKNYSIQGRNLFKVLLETEKLGWEKVIVDMTGIGGNEGLGPTIIERLKRAAEN